jgi:hypothetical protein
MRFSALLPWRAIPGYLAAGEDGPRHVVRGRQTMTRVRELCSPRERLSVSEKGLPAPPTVLALVLAAILLVVAAPAGATVKSAVATAKSAPSCNWTNSAKTLHFKIWTCTNTDKKNASATANAAEAAWSAMTADAAGLGTPASDGDAWIDVAIIAAGAPGPCFTVKSGCASLKPTESGATFWDRVTTSNGVPISSGYILIRTDVAGDTAKRKATLVHEFWHLQTFRYNATVAIDTSWFAEASATWAEHRWAPTESAAERASWFKNVFQPSDESLLATGDHAYGAWVWPLFVEQRNGAAQVAVGWKSNAARAATDLHQFDVALDTNLALTSSYRSFAVENINQDLGPSWPNYKQVDSAFPLGTADPKYQASRPLAADDDLTEPLNVPLMSARYKAFLLPAGSRRVTVDFAPFVNSGQYAQVDVAAHNTSGTWQLFQFGGGAGNAAWKFCRDQAGNDFDRFVFVATNATLDASSAANGTFTIRTAKDCARLTGTISWREVASTSLTSLSNVGSTTINMVPGTADHVWDDDGLSTLTEKFDEDVYNANQWRTRCLPDGALLNSEHADSGGPLVWAQDPTIRPRLQDGSLRPYGIIRGIADTVRLYQPAVALFPGTVTTFNDSNCTLDTGTTMWGTEFPDPPSGFGAGTDVPHNRQLIGHVILDAEGNEIGYDFDNSYTTSDNSAEGVSPAQVTVTGRLMLQQ